MEKEQHEELKSLFQKTSQILNDKNLSLEEKREFEVIHTQLAGALLSTWLPAGFGRKFAITLMIVVAIYFFIQYEYILGFIVLILACMFSPRIIGEAAVLIGKIKGN
jgi:hypothetical protein